MTNTAAKPALFQRSSPGSTMMGEVNYVPVAIYPPAEGTEGERAMSVGDIQAAVGPSNAAASDADKYQAIFSDMGTDLGTEIGTADSALLFELRSRNLTLLRTLHKEEERRRGAEKELGNTEAQVRYETTSLQRKLNGARQHVQSLQTQIQVRDQSIAHLRGEVADMKMKMAKEAKKSTAGWAIVSRNLAMIQKMRKRDTDLKRLRMRDISLRVATEKDAMAALEKLKPLEQKNIELKYENDLYKRTKGNFTRELSRLRKQVELEKDNACKWEDAVMKAWEEKEATVNELCEKTMAIQALNEEKASLVDELEVTTKELQRSSEELERARTDLSDLRIKDDALSSSHEALGKKHETDSVRLRDLEFENGNLKQEMSDLKVALAKERSERESLENQHAKLLTKYNEMKEHSPMLDNIRLTKKNKEALKWQKRRFERDMGDLASEMSAQMFSGKHLIRMA